MDEEKQEQEVKEIEAFVEKNEDGDLLAIASTEDEDRMDDELDMDNWQLKNYKKNPVLQAGHSKLPQHTIGVAKNLRIEEDKLVFNPEFHEITDLASSIKEMYEEGVLKAWSVGFRPIQDSEKNELLEISSVAVPANQNALTVSKDVITDSIENKKQEIESDDEVKDEVEKWVKSVIEKKAEEKDEEDEDKEEEKVHNAVSESNKELHTLHFDKDNFDDKAQVANWIDDNSYRTASEIRDESGEFRSVHRPMTDFDEDTMEKVELTQYVDATIGLLRKSMDDVQEKGAVGEHRPETADKDLDWDSEEAVSRLRRYFSSDGSGEKDTINFENYKTAFGWFDDEEPENFGSYKLPHHDVQNGDFVVHWRGVAAAMAALNGARGGVDVPEEDRRDIYEHLVVHYEQFGEEPPELKDYEEYQEKIKQKDEDGDSQEEENNNSDDDNEEEEKENDSDKNVEKQGRKLSEETRESIQQAMTALDMARSSLEDLLTASQSGDRPRRDASQTPNTEKSGDNEDESEEEGKDEGSKGREEKDSEEALTPDEVAENTIQTLKEINGKSAHALFKINSSNES